MNNKDKESKYIIRHSARFFILFTCIILFILALGETVMLGKIPLTKVWYPYFVKKLLSIFASIGRFIWPVYYMIFLYLLVKLNLLVKDRKKFIGCFLLLFVFQLVDLSGMLIDYHNFYHPNPQIDERKIVPDKFLSSSRKYHFCFLTDISLDEMMLFGKNVLSKNTLNRFYLARGPWDDINKNMEEIRKSLIDKSLSKDIVCIFKDTDDLSWFAHYDYDILNANGYVFVYKK